MPDLTLPQKIGQMLMLGWQGSTEEENLTVSEHARALAEEFQVGGIILMGRNVDTPEQAAATVNELQALSEIPLFIAADQEGGLVTRFKHPFAVFPGNMALGATRSADYCRRAAQATAAELVAVGVNFNFAPCVDVNVNPENPIIGVRSYGECPKLVAELGTAAIKGYQSMGVLACAKHFPGHGDTSVDTHFALPVINYGRERLEAVELRPFRTAVEAGTASVMTTHIAFPALDGGLPATLSDRVIAGVLRGEMGYEGLVITDCLEMKAIADNYGTAEAAVLAVKAGVDILLACHTLDAQRELRDGLLRAVESGVISEQRIDESVARILATKQKYGLDSRRKTDADALGACLGTPGVRELEREIAERSITLVRNEDGLLPLRPAESDRVAVLGMHAATDLFAEAVRARHADTRHVRVSTSPTPAQLAQVEVMARESKAVLVTTCRPEPWTNDHVDEKAQAELVDRILESGAPTIVVAATEPYDLRHFPKARTCIATYGYPDAVVRAAVQVIFGLIEPRGALPVSVPSCAKFGAGQQGFARCSK